MVQKQILPRATYEGIKYKIVERAALRGPVRIFGEMVAVLWAEGKTRTAIRLEELWDELATRHAFSLLCAYPMSAYRAEG